MTGRHSAEAAPQHFSGVDGAHSAQQPLGGACAGRTAQRDHVHLDPWQRFEQLGADWPMKPEALAGRAAEPLQEVD